MTTKYSVIVDGEQVAIKGKKQVAIDLAQAKRDEQKVAVEVRTEAGKVVFAQAAPKKINMSKPFTRDDSAGVAGDDIELIDGKRVAYKRPRVGFALLDANLDATDAGNGTYSIWDLRRHETVDVEIATTREAGRWFADEAKAYRAEHPALVEA